MKKKIFYIILGLSFWNFLVFAQLSESIGVTAIPPVRSEPSTPLSFIMSSLDDARFREAIFKEQSRFKLLHKELPFRDWSEGTSEYEFMIEYSKKISKMFLNTVKEHITEKFNDHFLENFEHGSTDNPFRDIINLIKQTRDIARHFKSDSPQRKIAMSFKPHFQEPSLNISNLLFDQTQITYNTLFKSPAFSVEQKLAPNLSSTVSYQMLFQTLDSALKRKINDQINFHIINRNQFNAAKEKSVIFGVSIDMN